MKNLPLFVTLGVISLMGALAPVNSGTPANEEPTTNSSIILETPEETTAEGTNIELEDSTLEAQVEDEIPVVDAPVEGEMEETPMATEEDAELEAADSIELVDPNSDDVILPATDSAEIPVGEEAAELVEPATESAE